MPEEIQKPDHLKDFAKYRDKVAELERILSGAIKGPTSTEKRIFRPKYEEALSEYRPDFDYGNDEKARLEDFGRYIRDTQEEGNDTLLDHLDEILEDIKPSTLDGVISMNSKEKPTLFATSEIDAEVMKRYYQVQSAKGIMDSYKNQNLKKEEIQGVKEEVAKMYALDWLQSIKKVHQEKGIVKNEHWYSEHFEFVYSGAIRHLKPEKFESIATDMLDKSVKEAEKEYTAFVQEKAEGRDIYAIAKDSMRILASQGGDQFSRIADTIYKSYKANSSRE